jgi:hypothetical protein
MIEIDASIAQEAGRWHKNVLQATRKVMENLGVSSAINFEVAGLDPLLSWTMSTRRKETCVGRCAVRPLDIAKLAVVLETVLLTNGEPAEIVLADKHEGALIAVGSCQRAWHSTTLTSSESAIRAPIPAALSYSRRWKSESPERSLGPST